MPDLTSWQSTPCRCGCAVGSAILALAASVASAGIPGQAWFRTFEAQEVALGATPTDVVLGDLDGDGDIDAVIAFASAAAPRVLLNDGTGIFADAISGITANPIEALALVDVDGDSDFDLVEAGALDRLWLNVGNGAFIPGPTTFPAGGSTRAAPIDIDGDGDADLLFGGADGALRVFVNQGGAQAGTPGAFLAGQVVPPPAGLDPIIDLALADLDLDLDLDVVSIRGSTLRVHRNDGGVLMAGPTRNVPGATALALGEFNGDALPDLVVARFTGSGTAVSSWLFGLGNGQFLPSFVRFAPGNHVGVAIADLDGQPGQEVLLVGPPPTNTFVTGLLAEAQFDVWLPVANGNDFLHRQQCLDHRRGTVVAVAVADLDGDLDLDIAFVRQDLEGASFGIHRNGPTGTIDVCCPAEAAYRVTSSDPEGDPAPDAPRGATPVFDLALLRAVRDQVMAPRSDGARLVQDYADLGPDLLAVMVQDIGLTFQINATLRAWEPNLAALLDGNGSSVTVTAQQINAVDSILQNFTAAGSPALVQTIADERSRLPPFAQFIGIDMDGFADIVLGGPVALFADGFEDTP